MRDRPTARNRIGVAVAALLALNAPAVAAPRVASINLCTDQLVLAFADPDQIVGLSPYATDPLRSFEAERARAFRRLSGTAEEIVFLKPDLVLAGRFTKRATRELVRAHGFRLVELDAPRSVQDARRQLAEAASLLGHPERGEAATARVDRALAAAREAASARPFTVLPLQRRGWVAGGRTLVTSLLDAVGLKNAGADFSRGLGRRVTLEEIVALRPDRLLLSSEEGGAEDQGSALLQHPALARLYPPERRLVLPDRYASSCGGPGLADTIAHLAAGIRQMPP